MRTAEFVRVTYRTDEMQCAVNDMLDGYKRLPSSNRTQLPLVEAAIETIMHGQLTDRVSWRIPGLTFEFSGFPAAVLKASEGRLLASPSTPHILFEEEVDPNLTLDETSAIRNILTTGINTVSNDHPVELDSGYPITIVRFPAETFAADVEIFEVPLLGNEELRI